MFFQIEIHEPTPGLFRAALVRCEQGVDRLIHSTDDHASLEEAEAECRDVLQAMYGQPNQVAA